MSSDEIPVSESHDTLASLQNAKGRKFLLRYSFRLSSDEIPVHCIGDASKRCQNTFQIEMSNWKDFSSFACVPTGWYKRDGFTGNTGNIWYKLRLLSQPSNTRTNISKHASGPIRWLISKCKQYKLRPPQILQIPRSRLCQVCQYSQTPVSSLWILLSTLSILWSVSMLSVSTDLKETEYWQTWKSLRAFTDLTERIDSLDMGWLRLVGSWKS